MGTGSYDVVVIGSGIGGMSSAALLAHAGYKVLVAEKYPWLGGRFSTREYKGYKLPTGAIGIETGGVLESIFKQVGAPFEVTPAPPLYYWIDGKNYEMPSRGGIRALVDILAKTEADRAKIVGRIAKEVATEKIMGAFKRGVTGEAEPGTEKSFRDWLLQYTDNERVLAVFRCVIMAMFCINDAEMPARQFFHFVSKGVGSGYRVYGHATRGNITLVEGLAQVVKGKGGEVWTEAEAQRILVKDGAAKGVVIRKDSSSVEIDSQVVISNAGPKKTVEMAGRASFDSDYLRRADGQRQCPVLSFLVGADRPFIDLPGMVNPVGTRSLYQYAPVSNICPAVAPPGKHLLVTFGGPSSSLYPMNSRVEIDKHLEDLREIFPGFESYAEILRADARNIDDEWPAYHAWAGQDLPQKTPVKNLYDVGDGNKPLGKTGLPASGESGLIAAREVQKTIKPRNP